MIFGNNDGNHIFKRFRAHLASGTKCVRWGSLICNLTSLVSGGLPVRALAVEDQQCDKSYAKRLNPGFLDNSWSSFGCNVAQFVSSLFISAWTASSAFNMRDALSNALLGYYLMLVQTMIAMKEHGAKKWRQHWLPPQTIRNMCDLAGHYVLSCRFWPEAVPWKPSARQESTIEHFFGRIKSHTRGTPSVKDGLMGVCLEHSRLLRSMPPSDAVHLESAVGECELANIAETALDNAVLFQANLETPTRCTMTYHDIS